MFAPSLGKGTHHEACEKMNIPVQNILISFYLSGKITPIASRENLTIRVVKS